MHEILVVEDEPGVVDALRYALKAEGFLVTAVTTLAAARTRLALARPHLVLLDAGLPDGSGFDLLRDLRRGDGVPVVMLTARSAEVDRVVGLELGADDYVAKPFSPRELVARIRAVLRRCAMTLPTGSAGPVELDAAAFRARFFSQPLDLTRYEFRLLVELASAPGRVFSRAELLDRVWEDPGAVNDRTVDTHVKTLRAKLRAIRPEPEAIETVRGEGYRLREQW